MTFVGIQIAAGMAILLVNRGVDTVALVTYDDEAPVVITELP